MHFIYDEVLQKIQPLVNKEQLVESHEHKLITIFFIESELYIMSEFKIFRDRFWHHFITSDVRACNFPSPDVN